MATGKAAELLQHRREGVKVARPFQALEIALRFGLGLFRFQQQDHGLRRQVIGEVGPVASGPAQDGHLDRVECFQTALTGDVEPADRFDLVSKELDANRLVPVRGEDIQDAAAAGELARQLDRAGVVETALDQPPQKGRHVDGVADPQTPAIGGQQLSAGRRLQQTLDAGDDQLQRRLTRAGHGPLLTRPTRRRRIVEQTFQRAQTFAIDFIVQNPFARCGFPSRKPLGRQVGEELQVVAERIRVVLVRADDDQHPGQVLDQFRRHQRARRAPHSVPRHILAAGQSGHGIHEAWLRRQTSGQFAHFPRRHGSG